MDSTVSFRSSKEILGSVPEWNRDVLGTFSETCAREWLVTNGIGGFAAGTVGLANTRRYHGLLIAALRPPVQRVAMVMKLDVVATYAGREVALGTNEFADGTIAPRGYCHLESFRLEGLTPVWHWLIGDLRLEQRIWMRHGENTTYVEFRRVGGEQLLHLSMAPLCTNRDYHWHSRGERPYGIERVPDGVRIKAPEGAPAFQITGPGADLVIQPQWYWQFKHRHESARGLDDLEDLLRPAIFGFNLDVDHAVSLILTAESHPPMPARDAKSAEEKRQQALRAQWKAVWPAPVTLESEAWIERLVLAADQFLVERRDSSGAPLGMSIIAGYPWFTDWGRDTLIALPGLTPATGRAPIAASVLRTFARYVSEGMIPNRFADSGDAVEYNTADASLWFFVAVHEYLLATNDAAFLTEMYPVLRDIIERHRRGTRFGIRIDPADDLLCSGEPGVQVTWMDAKVGDWVVTPRIGKAVKINALWFNAVSILRDLAADLRHAEDQATYGTLAAGAAAADLLREIPAHLREARIGQVSEIMDGDPPFGPAGCVAQAWGVAEILRALRTLV